jgi:hypothetical protein
MMSRARSTDASFDAHELEQMRRFAALPFAEKVR